jgi:hypothetical protein
MKQRILFIVAIIALTLFASEASAQGVRVEVRGNAETAPVRAEVRQEMRAQVETRDNATSTERKEEVRALVETRSNATSSERQREALERRMEVQANAAKRLAANTARVLFATIERLERIIARLESRIEKFEARGGVTAGAKVYVAEAQAHIDLAKEDLRAFASVELTGERAQENFSRVRARAAEVKMHIRNAHTSLKNAVVSLKASAGVEVDADN